MRATRFLLAAMVLVTAIGASQANAQLQCNSNAGTCSTINTASVTVGALVKLGMSSVTTTLTSPLATDVESGLSLDDVGPTFTIKANRSWNLKVKSQNPTNFTYGGSDGGVKPISDLSWAITSGGSYSAITASDVTFASGVSATNSTPAAAFFRTSWAGGFSAASNAPGTYSLPIIFTLTAP